MEDWLKCRCYTIHGKLIPRSKYSSELKQRIKSFKKECPIPHYQLWKGFIYVLVAILLASAIFAVKNRIESNTREKGITAMISKLSQIEVGQLYAVSFFSNLAGQSINGLPEGWIRVVKVEEDVIFAQRSKRTNPVSPIFDMDKLIPILPQGEQDWETAVEKFDYKLLSKQLAEPVTSGRFDLLYAPEDREIYSGVVLSIKGVLASAPQK